ncbi:hypothetical protein V1525DRAFT_409442, partial [Lipomyces kononenkoae]
MFDCSGYYFHFRRCKEKVDGPEFVLTCSRSEERKTEREPETVQRYTKLRVAFVKSIAVITYDHKCHTETPKFHVTEEVQNYIRAHQLQPPRLIYQNLIQMADSPQFKNTDLYMITRQQVYSVWISLTRKEWERDAADDFRSV